MLHGTQTTDANGRVTADPLTRYVVTDGPTMAESSDDILYYMAVDMDGCWVIRKRTISTGTERFAQGRGDVETCFLPANRVNWTYDRVHKIL